MRILTILSLLLLLVSQSCKDKSKLYCIQDFTINGTFDLGELTIEVPGEQAYTGLGALPSKVKIGKYEGSLRSVIVKQTPADNGVITELRHHFDDGKGNQFWTHDCALMTPVNGSQTQFHVYDEMCIWRGTGDFECAVGSLVNEAELDAATNKLVVATVGSICGGCE